MTSSTQTAQATQVYRVYIKAAQQTVWDAITQPDWTERYMYDSRVDYELRPGGAYRAYPGEGMLKGAAEMGYPVPDVVCDGEVLEVDPPKRLVQTWRILMSEELAAEGLTRLTWEVDEVDDGVTRLTVIHEMENAPLTAVMVSGDQESEGAGGGWNSILSGLKTLLETGERMYKA